MDHSVFLRLLGAGLVLCLVATGTKAFAADPKFAYVANSVSGNVSVYTVDQTTGALTAGTAAAAGAYPISVAVDPSGRFVYVANHYSDNVSVYTIDQTTGALTAGTAVATGISPSSITVAPSGRFAYVANSRSDNVSVYTVDQATGALTAGTAVAAGSYPASVTVDHSGRFAYVTNRKSGNVLVYMIDQATGALTAVTAIAAETSPESVAIDPFGRFVYVANHYSDNVSVYTIDQTTGALTDDTEVAVAISPTSVTVDPSGRFAYVTSSGYYDTFWADSKVLVYSIDQTTGALTAGTAVAAGLYPISVTVDPSGRFAYVANYYSDNVSVYTIDQTTGALTAGTAAAAGSGPFSVTIAPELAIPPQNFTDSWYNASESGWGITITDHDTNAFVQWYTYDQTGHNQKYVISGGTFSNGKCLFTGDITHVTGPSWTHTIFDPNLVTRRKAGAGTINFCPTGLADGAIVFDYTADGITGSKKLTRLPFGDDAPHWGGVANTGVSDFSDLWYNPDESGWGVSITQHGHDIVFRIFVYDTGNRPLLFIVPSVTFNSTTSFTGNLVNTSGPWYGTEPFDPNLVTRTTVGTATLTFSDADNGVLSYTVNGVTVTKTITRLQF